MSKKKGLIFIIAAASGTGKTTLVHKLLAINPRIKVSVSHTTRQPREGEKDGQHYFFTTEEDFEARIAKNEFLEFAKVYRNYYGTSLLWINQTLDEGLDVLLEIDVQGAAQVKELLPDAVSIFILPPSLEVLGQRLTDRNSDADESVSLRLKEAESEIALAQLFDYIIVNEHLDEALQDLDHIVHSEHLKKSQQLPILKKLLAKP